MVPCCYSKKLLKTLTKPSAVLYQPPTLARTLASQMQEFHLPHLASPPYQPSDLRQAPRAPTSKLSTQWNHCINTLRPKHNLHLEDLVPCPTPQEEWGDTLRWCLVSILLGPVTSATIECMDPIIIDQLVNVYSVPLCVCC